MSEPTPDSANASRPADSPAAGSATAGSLLTSFAESLASFLAGKARLFEIEFARDMAGFRLTALFLLGVVVFLLLVILFASAGGAILIGERIGSVGGGFLVVAGAYLVAAGVLLFTGRQRMKRLRGFLGETRADLRRDMEWLKNLP